MIDPDVQVQLNRWHGDAVEMILHKVTKIDIILDSQKRLESAQEKMMGAITKLAVVEERQANMADAIERLTESLNKLDDRLKKLEESEPLQRQSTKWVFAAVGGAVAIVGTMILERVLLGP